MERHTKATFDFTAANVPLDLSANIFNYGFAETVENGGMFSFLNGGSITSDDIEISGIGLGFVGGANPYTGTITTLEIAADNTDETNPDLVITGVSIDASLIGSVPDAVAHRAVYAAAAIGSDSFLFGATNGVMQVFGDLVAVEAGATVISLNDTMTGGGGDQQRLVGDAGQVLGNATLVAGDDTFVGGFRFVWGDAGDVFAGATFTGGDDEYTETLFVGGPASVDFVGDVGVINGAAASTGGADVFTGAAGSLHGYTVSGDANFIDNTSFAGGADTVLLTAVRTPTRSMAMLLLRGAVARLTRATIC